MKYVILIIFAVVELQRPLSSCLELYIRNVQEKVAQGKHQTFNCQINIGNKENCSGLYNNFFWEALRSKQRLEQKISDGGCSVHFTINNTTKSDAGIYICTLITNNNQEIKKQLNVYVSPGRDTSQSCPITQTKCVGSGVCIFQRYRCDNFDDCTDGSDEQHCPNDKCADKFVCGNGRCIKKELQCNRQNDCGDASDEDDRCNHDEASTPEPPAMDDHFDWLKTTVYTVIGCTVAVVIFISFIVIVVFRVKMKRLRARRIARALERHRQHQGSTNQGRTPEQDPFLSIGSNSHYGNIIVNVNNGVQYVPTGDFTAFVDSPPPYHEVVASERDSSPPPPYSTIDRKPRQKGVAGVTMEACTNTSNCDLRDAQQPHTTTDMASIQEDLSDTVGAEGGVSISDTSPRHSSDLHPPLYPSSASEGAAAPGLTAGPSLPQPQHSPSNRSDSVPGTSRDNIPSSVDSRPQTPSTNQASLPRPARLTVQGGKIVLSAEEEAAANQQALSEDGIRPRQCHLKVREGQIVLTDMTQGDVGAQSPLTADGIVRGTGELEVRGGQIIFRPKET